jgi:hypothetical protein
MVDPKCMCRQHLLGEHNEVHILAGSLRKGDIRRHVRNLEGLARANCLEISSLVERHGILASEMVARGYSHQSPLTDVDVPLEHLERWVLERKVDTGASLELLRQRCPECRKRLSCHGASDPLSSAETSKSMP